MHLLVRGDARRLPLADGSVHCAVTSPPYWGLRDYGEPGQIGLERLPGEYVTRLVEVFREVRRVLRDDGTLWLNLGDSYATQSPIRMRNRIGYGSRPKDHPLTPKPSDIGYRHKDLIGIPWRVAFALQADGWYLRSDIIWAKPNPMPESVTDRPTRAHEYLFLLAKSERYYYDADAVREPHATPRPFRGKDAKTIYRGAISGGADNCYAPGPSGYGQPEGGRNRRSVWTVATRPYKGAHFAVMPARLAVPCVKAGCPRGGIVLDPFAGAGTTVLVAEALGRRGIGLDLSPKYLRMARRRITRPHAPIPCPAAVRDDLPGQLTLFGDDP
jgi:DNA modification methylase